MMTCFDDITELLPSNHNQIDRLVRQKLASLADTVWGRDWLNSSKKYTIYRVEHQWIAAGRCNSKSRQAFHVQLNFDSLGSPASFTVRHFRGESITQDISEKALGVVLKEAYRAEPALERIYDD